MCTFIFILIRLITRNKEKQEQIEELYLLQRVAQKINSILDPDTLLEEIVGDVAETIVIQERVFY
ncbi:MAG: hypothetical protein Kow0098_02040 [Ignavibacteriaceae bacterium]